MNMKMESFLAVLNALNEFKVEYVLVGGLAVVFQDINRFTKDLDIFVKRDIDNIDRLRQARRKWPNSLLSKTALSDIQRPPEFPGASLY